MRGSRNIFLLLLTLLLPAIAQGDDEWQLLRVNGASMEPTIHHGDIVCLHRGVQKLNVGDLVAIRLSEASPPLLKRVIAVAGDRVEIDNGEIRRNGEVVTTGPTNHRQLSALRIQLASYDNVIPANNLIVLGDNPELSFDSSSFGLVEISQISGVVVRQANRCAGNRKG